MGEGHGNPVLDVLSAPVRWLWGLRRSRRQQPPLAGVREPRRPRPTLPAAAVALDEPRIEVRRIRLRNRRDD